MCGIVAIVGQTPVAPLIVDALKRHGVELLPETGERGAGARWVQPRGTRIVLKSTC